MPLTIYRRGEIWHYRGTVAGRRLRGSCKTSNKKTAQRLASEIETRQWKGHLDGPEAVLTFSQAAILYRDAEKPTRFLAPIEDYWKDTLVKNITEGAIRQSALQIYPNACSATRNRQVIVPSSITRRKWISATRFQPDDLRSRRKSARQLQRNGLRHLPRTQTRT